MITKRVNIFPLRGAITATNPPIRSPQAGVMKDIKDIRYCILAGAKVEEILPEGRKVVLSLQNYDLDNSQSPYATPAKGATVFTSSPKGSPSPIIQSPISVPEPNPFQQKSPMNEEVKIANAPELPAVGASSDNVNIPSEESKNDENVPDTPSQGESTQNPDKPRLTRKERRALERAAAQEESKQQPDVIVTDPEIN